MGRAPCCAKVGLKKGRWSAEEDAILINYIKQRGEAGAGSWRSLPRNAGLLRCGKSCRLRWINYLRSDLRRGNFTSHEQDTIIKLHAQLGNKWSMIANQLEGRTDNEIKNYWNSSLSKRATTNTSDTLLLPIISSSPSTPPSSLNVNINSIIAPASAAALVLPQATAAAGAGDVIDNAVVLVKKRRGRTSRAAMKKNQMINTCVIKSNKYHLISGSSSSSSISAITNCSLSRTNSCTSSTYDLNIVCLSSSAMTSTQLADDALNLNEGFVLESLLFGQNDSQSCIMNHQNIYNLLDLDAANLHEGVGSLSFEDDVGMIADIYREYELAVEGEGRCDTEIKTTMETSSVSLLASPKQSAAYDDIQGALLSGEWDWINNVIVHPDINDNQIWSDELDGNSITWLWEYEQ